MSNALQNRLVGTVILVAVTVIFLPDYLDGKKQTNTESFVDFPQSTSNLSAVAPDTFPTEEVANATRREIVVVEEEASDALLEKSQSNDGATDGMENGNSDDTNNDTSNEVSAANDKAAEERRIAEQMAKNVQAANNKDANTKDASEDNSLANQTVVKTEAAGANDNAGWVVQLGSFGNQKNVNDLIRKLEKAGYRTFSRKVQTSAGRLTKVFVGPELDKEKLDLALPHLKETTGLTGKVTTFNVVSD
ncbi:SPOR domain-containing protein [Glaciecola sp.]|uniref:SPOR domain-containing protein n=1 Tax=Glaciecola sp. MF2-115 TaxID=3384827 RepID=UPI00398A2F9D